MSSTNSHKRRSTLDPGSYRGSYEFIGGDLTLDFVNTISWRKTDRAHEWLSSYTNLLDWAMLAGAISSPRSKLLIKISDLHPVLANRVVARAINLREALNVIITSTILPSTPSSRQMAILNSHLSLALQQLNLSRANSAFLWAWRLDEPRLDEVLWPVVWSACNLFISERRNQIGHCEGCGWVFLDTTKNHTRRWCVMKDCGNRAKAHRYRLRHR